jgi:hypothetical protein
MKMKLTRTLILTAVALMGTVAAHGEALIAAADVPFGFRAAGVEFRAGVYQISDFERTGVLSFKNAKTGSKFVKTIAPANETEDRNARLQFVCAEDRGCALSKIVLSNGRQWNIRIPRVKASETKRTAAVYLDQKQAD